MLKGCALGPSQSADGATVYTGPADYAHLAAIGAQIVRLDLDAWTPQRVLTYQTILAALRGAQIQVIGLLGPGLVQGARQADWNAGNAENGGPGDNPYLAAYADQALTCVSVYGTYVSHWEIGNEPNAATAQSGPLLWGGTFMYPSLYVALLQRVYPRIKDAQPQATVLTGGLLAHSNGGIYTPHNAACDYLDSLYQNGLAGAYDAIGYHMYIDQTGPLDPEHVQRYLTWIHEVVAWWAERPAIPLYITESGQQSAVVGPAVQARSLAEAFRVYRTNSYVVAAALNFGLHDGRGSGMSYALYDAQGVAKPSAAAFTAA